MRDSLISMASQDGIDIPNTLAAYLA